MMIYKRFTFEAAHWLPMVPKDHKCRRMHGHSWSVTVYASGDVDPASGFVIDFADIKQAAGSVIDGLDHRCLNDIRGLDNPTSENVARWLCDRIRGALPSLCRIEVDETCNAGCVCDVDAARKLVDVPA